MKKISYATYLKRYQKHPLIDVRSPLEFKKGHIFSAVNIPLFSNQQRAIVGTLYKQQGRKRAMFEALKFVSMPTIAQKADRLNSPTLVVHCARGGMRSYAVSWLLEFLGYKVLTLELGYKGYRRWVLEQFQKTYPLFILSGKTGVGKTFFLKKLTRYIDLEGLACHKGSAFGAYQRAQPTQESFENLLAYQLYRLNNPDSFKNKNLNLKQNVTQNKDQFIWLEDESRSIGKITIPEPFFKQMQTASGLILEDSQEKRIQRILAQYRYTPLEKLKSSILKLQKRLGSEDTKKALFYLENNDKKNCCALLLKYYDKTYDYTLKKRKQAKDCPLLDLSLKNNSQAMALLKDLNLKIDVLQRALAVGVRQ